MDTDDLLRLLRRSTRECLRGGCRAAVAYSGGLDSAVVEALAREVTETVCRTCAMVGSRDHSHAVMLSASGDMDVRLVTMTGADLERLVSEAGAVLGTSDPVRVAYTVPTMCSIDSSEEGVVLSGSGADELFGGYVKYTRSVDPHAEMARDLDKVLSETELLKEYAQSCGKRYCSPYLCPEVIAFANGLPLDRKLGQEGRKVVLRGVAASLGLPSASAPKKAAQYSSGVMKAIRAAAKREGLTSAQWTGKVVARARRTP